jgi:hypothetical protein
MPLPKPFGKEDILRAMRHTKSNMAAARYLNCSYIHYKKWAKLYDSDKPEFKSLFDEHKNQSGKGIPKFLGGKNEPALMDILEGRVNAASFTPARLKTRLIQEGHIEEKCTKCDFQERRVNDYKMPLLLSHKDGNKKNWHIDNLEMLCYNHFFLYVGDIFTDKQIEGIEDHKPLNEGFVDWEVDSYHLQRLKELGLGSDVEEEDDYDIVSRI